MFPHSLFLQSAVLNFISEALSQKGANKSWLHLYGQPLLDSEAQLPGFVLTIFHISLDALFGL